MLEQLTERIRAIDFNRIFDEVLDGERFFILDLIRSQLLKGETGDEYAIGFYSKSEAGQDYVQWKTDYGLFPVDTGGKYNLMLEGHFYDSLIISINPSVIEITSTDSKKSNIEEHLGYGIDSSDLLTLQQDNLQILIERIKPKLQKKINDYFGI